MSLNQGQPGYNEADNNKTNRERKRTAGSEEAKAHEHGASMGPKFISYMWF